SWGPPITTAPSPSSTAPSNVQTGHREQSGQQVEGGRQACPVSFPFPLVHRERCGPAGTERDDHEEDVARSGLASRASSDPPGPTNRRRSATSSSSLMAAKMGPEIIGGAGCAPGARPNTRYVSGTKI